MRISDDGLTLIKTSEGLELKAYLCPAGVWTIGYGTTEGVTPGMEINVSRAEQLLRQDVAKFEQGVTRAVKVPLSQHQFDALVSFAYNVGLGSLRSSTLLRLLNAGDYDGAAKQFGRWNRAGKRVLAGLTRRRAAERAMFEGRRHG